MRVVGSHRSLPYPCWFSARAVTQHPTGWPRRLMLNRSCAGEALRTILASLLGLLPAPRPYGFGEAEDDGEAEGVGEAEGDAVGEGEAVGGGEDFRSVVSSVALGFLEGMGVVAAVESVRSVVCGSGSYGPLSATDSVIPTSAAAIATTGVRTTTRGTRTSGRTHPSKMYHSSTATTTSTAATIHHGYPIIGSTYPPNTLFYQDRGPALSRCGA
jgi:hypothetical protein